MYRLCGDWLVKKEFLFQVVDGEYKEFPLKSIYDSLGLKLDFDVFNTPEDYTLDENSIYNRKVIYDVLCQIKEPLIDLENEVVDLIKKYNIDEKRLCYILEIYVYY